MATIYLTRKGYEGLTEELRELIEERRPQVIADLAQAREYGDISENAEYEQAKRDQGMIEGRIHELESLLSSARVLKMPTDVTEAELGVRMVIENSDMKQKRECLLVSEQEAHLDEIYLSVESPLGKALLGSRVGDLIEFQAPAGLRRFKVLELHGCNGETEE